MKIFYVSYPVEGYFGLDVDLDEKIMPWFEDRNFDWPGSGSGFGQRDHDFLKDVSEDDAKNICEEFLAYIENDKVTIEFDEYEDDE